MSSVGQAAGGLVGGAIGFFVGGPSGAYYGAQIGLMIGGAIDPPKGPTINGPRLDDLSVQTSTYGAFIPRVYGTVPQTGNVFWIKGDALTEVQNTSTSGGKGGPQTTTNTFSYFATFAVGLCEGPIDGVRRIWIGSDLFYDAGSDDLSTIIASNQNAATFTLYLGTDTQDPDPLIQADKGVANVPAYRGLAYIVFDDLPLENHSNSLVAAQVKVEIVKSATFAQPRLLSATDVDGYPVKYYPRPGYRGEDGVISFYAYDPFAGTTSVDGELIANDEVLVQVDYSANYVLVSDIPSDVVRPQFLSTGVFTTEIGALGSASTGQVWWPEYASSYAIQNGTRSIIPWGTINGRDTADVAGSLGDIADYLTGEAGRYVSGIAISANLRRILVTTAISPRNVAETADRYFILDDEMNILQSGSIAVPTADIWSLCNSTNEAPNGGTVLDDSEYVGWTAYVTGIGEFRTRYFYVDSAGVLQISSEILESISGLDYLAVYYSDRVFYVLVRTSSIARLYVYTAFPTLTSGLDTLGSIVESECLASNLLTAGDLDVTALTDSVRGYRVSQLGAIRAGLDPLRAAWPFDVRQHGYQIEFVRRGGASVATIPASDLDARAAGQAPGVSIADVREMDLMLPRQVSVKYLDATREYDINEQIESRANTDAVGYRAVDLPIVMTAAEAKQATAALLYLYWMERYDINFVLPPSYQQLEPGDPVDVEADNATYNLRLTTVTWLPDGRVECRAKYNSAALYTQVSVADEGQSTGATLGLAGPSAYELLDIPLIRDDDDTAGFPVAMTGYLAGWPGGVLYRSDDSGQTWADLTGVTAPGAVIGYATGTLAAHGGTVIDFTSTLAVRLYSGSLASVTQAQMFAGQNWFAYGAHGRWEIIAAQNCVLQGDGSYVLSDFLRGQKGTEWATGLHVAYDRLVLLDASALAFISVNASTIGATRTFRAITTGKALSSDTDHDFAYAGVNLECLSPVHLTGNRHPGTNDWTLTWTRRGRLDSWRDYVDLPLGETSESYEVDVYADGTYAVVKRTLTASTPTVAYTSAQQVTDFGSNQATLCLKVYQLSATVGRGYALTQSVTR